MKKLNIPELLVASAFLATVSFGVSASTVSESTDFPGSSSFFPGAFSAGTLSNGANTISGALAGNCVIGDCNGASAGDTQDSVLFTIGTGFQLDSIFVTTSNVSGPAGFSASFDLRNPSTNLVFTPFLPLNTTSGNQLTSLLSAGTYSLSMFGQGASAAGAYALDYSIGLNVSAVPIPGAVWLFGSALAGLLASKRRHTKMA